MTDLTGTVAEALRRLAADVVTEDRKAIAADIRRLAANVRDNPRGDYNETRRAYVRGLNAALLIVTGEANEPLFAALHKPQDTTTTGAHPDTTGTPLPDPEGRGDG